MDPHDAAVRILKWFHFAEQNMVGKTAWTFTGETGVITEVRLDGNHGLCFSFDESPSRVFRGDLPPVRWYPVSTIREI